MLTHASDCLQTMRHSITRGIPLTRVNTRNCRLFDIPSTILRMPNNPPSKGDPAFGPCLPPFDYGKFKLSKSRNHAQTLTFLIFILLKIRPARNLVPVLEAFNELRRNKHVT